MKFLLPFAAVMSMVAAPAMAAPQAQRVEQRVEGNSELRGGAGGFVIGLLALGLAVVAILTVSKFGDDDPNSP